MSERDETPEERAARVAAILAEPDGRQRVKRHGNKGHPDRVSTLREYGAKFAAYIRANPKAYQVESALKVGIAPRTWTDWMNGDGPEHDAFRAEVLPAIFEQAQAFESAAEADIASAPGGSGAWAGWHKWKLGMRFRQVYGEAPGAQKVELSGPGGGAVQVDAISRMSDSELLAIATGAVAARLPSADEDE
jgi:hypothetical protein